jgi:hypothetical protein
MENVMLREVDIDRAAHLMVHSHGGDAELEAAIYADRMLGAQLRHCHHDAE